MRIEAEWMPTKIIKRTKGERITFVVNHKYISPASYYIILASCGSNRHGEKELLANHYQPLTPFGMDTPYRRLLDVNARILCLGVDLGPVTFYHVFEDLIDDDPIWVYYQDALTCRVTTCDGDVIQAKTKVHDPAIADYRIDRDPGIRAIITRILREWNVVTESSVGESHSFLFKTGDLISALECMLSQGITIYNVERMRSEGHGRFIAAPWKEHARRRKPIVQGLLHNNTLHYYDVPPLQISPLARTIDDLQN